MSQRAIIYARVSTEDQVERYGLPAQLRACREYAAANGLQVLEEISDEGISGGTLDRGGLDRLRALVEDRAADVLVMLDPDRLSRKLGHLVHIKPELEKHVRIEFVTGSFEDSASGRLFFNIKGSIAEYEREVIRDRTMRGKRERARSGLLVGGRTCYGYRYDEGKLVIDPERGPIAQTIYAQFDAGVSLRSIALGLRASGAPTWSGRRWGFSSVRRILTNETYAGVAHYLRSRRAAIGRELRPAAEQIALTVPALVSRALWDRVQARFAENAIHGNRPGGRPPARVSLLKGILWCSCGRRMAAERGARSNAYRCHGRDALRHTGSRCPAAANASKVDEAVWREIVSVFGNAKRLRALVAEHQASLQRVDPQRAERLEDGARKLRRREGQALSLMLDPDLAADRATIKREYQEAQRARVRIEGELAALRRAEASAGSSKAWIEATVSLLREDLAAMEAMEDRQAFVRGLVTRAEWNGEAEALKMRCLIGPKLGTMSSRCAQFPECIELVLNVRLAA